MQVKHITLEPNTATHVKLEKKAGEILVKNRTSGDLLVSIEKEDFNENYVNIPSMMGEVLTENTRYAASKPYFFDDIYLKSSDGGEVEIRSLTI